MRKLLTCVASILVLSACDQFDNVQDEAVSLSGQKCPDVIGVWPVWETKAQPNSGMMEQLSHLAIAFALPTAEGGLNTVDVDRTLEAIRPTAESTNIPLILSIGGAAGYDDAFIVLSKDANKRAKFVKKIVDYVAEKNFSGVDIDWEIWTQQTQKGLGGNDPVESVLLVELLKDLRLALPSDVRLSTDIFAGSYYGSQYLSEIQEHVDSVNLMAFDFTGQWSQSTIGHHSLPTMVERAFEDVNGRGFASNIIVLGVPAYGVKFENGKNSTVSKIPIREIESLTGLVKEKALKDGRYKDTYFETPHMTKTKVRSALKRGVTGFFIFDLTQDSTDPNWGILNALRATVSETGCKR